MDQEKLDNLIKEIQTGLCEARKILDALYNIKSPAYPKGNQIYTCYPPNYGLGEELLAKSPVEAATIYKDHLKDKGLVHGFIHVSVDNEGTIIYEYSIPDLIHLEKPTPIAVWRLLKEVV